MTKTRTILIVSILFILAIIWVYYIGPKIAQKQAENNWAPIYRDPKKEYLAMRGMANESNSVAGMIGNPIVGAMKHKGSLG